MSYYSFLKDQNSAFQDETLGADLGGKMRSGVLDEKAFRKLNMDQLFRPMTIAEAVAKEDLAFS
jgi:hypothetical protein